MRRAIGNPTKSQLAYHDAVIGFGCVISRFRRQAQPNRTTLHHRNVGDLHGQKQLGHDYVVAMSAYHHLGELLPGWTESQMREEYGPSFALHARDFRAWTADVLPGYGRGTEAWQRWQEEQMGEAA